MTLPSSGTIQLSQIKTEFGGPNNLKSYYRGGTYVPNTTTNANIPTSGAINVREFLGASSLQTFVAVGSNGTIVTSADGVTWTSRTTANNSNDAFSVAYGNGVFVIGGSATSTTKPYMMTSTDGKTWTNQTGWGNTGVITSLCYGNGIWIGAGSNSTPSSAYGVIEHSTNGTTWTDSSIGSGYSALTPGGSTYGNGYFVVGDTNSWALYSSDGVTWNNNNTGQYNVMACYGNGIFLVWMADFEFLTGNTAYLAVGFGSWAHFATANTANGYALCYGNGVFVAAGVGGSIQSSNSSIWLNNGTSCFTDRTSATGNDVLGLAYSNSLGLFVAVGNNGFISTSTDSITWTLRTSPVSTNLYAVTASS